MRFMMKVQLDKNRGGHHTMAASSLR